MLLPSNLNALRTRSYFPGPCSLATRLPSRVPAPAGWPHSPLYAARRISWIWLTIVSASFARAVSRICSSRVDASSTSLRSRAACSRIKNAISSSWVITFVSVSPNNLCVNNILVRACYRDSLRGEAACNLNRSAGETVKSLGNDLGRGSLIRGNRRV
jgi:hypothetical protein